MYMPELPWSLLTRHSIAKGDKSSLPYSSVTKTYPDVSIVPCRGRSRETFTPAISMLPQEPEGAQLIDMEARIAGLVSKLRSAGGQVQALFLTGPPGSGELAALMSP